MNPDDKQEYVPIADEKLNQGEELSPLVAELQLAASRIQDGTATDADRNLVEAFNLGAAEAAKEVETPGVQEANQETVESETTAPPQQVEQPSSAKPVEAPINSATAQEAEPEKPNQPIAENDTTDESHVLVEDMLGATNRQIQRIADDIDTKKAWGDEVSDLETELKGHEDMRDYLLGRDYRDKRDRIHDANTGQFKVLGDANNAHEESSSDQPYEDLPLLKDGGLLDKWADAEDHGDKTMSSDIQDEIFRRIEKEEAMDDAHKLQLIDTVEKEMNKRRAHAPEETETAPAENGQDAEETDKQTDGEPSNENPEAKNNDEQEVKVPQAPELQAKRRLALDKAIEQYAKAKLRATRLFSGKKSKIEFESSAVVLKTKFNQFVSVIPETMAVADQALENARNANSAEISEIGKQLGELNDQKQSFGEQYDGSLDSQINDLQTKLEAANETKKGIDSEYEQREGNRQAYITARLMETMHSTNQAVLNERARSHPKLTKFMNYLRSHPKTRLAVSAGLTALGFVGASTFDAPLVALATVGKGLLRGYGSYDLVQQLGERKAARDVSQSELKTVDDYLASSTKEAATLRNYKRGGAVVGSILAVGPIAWSLVEGHSPTLNRAAHNGAHPQQPSSVGDHPTPTNSLDIKPVDGSTLPWDYAMNSHLGNLSSRLPELVNNHYGIHFTGNGLSGGQGAIESVTIPGQGTFTDLGHINGAIQFILGGGK